MRKIDRRIVIIAALIFIVGLAYGLMRYLIYLKEDPFMRPAVEAKRFVRAEPVAYRTIISPVGAEGRLTSVSEIDLVAEASGKILAGDIPLKTGATFSKGDVLFTVYPDETALALKARKSQFLNMLANLLPDISIDFPDHEQSYRDFFSSIEIDKKLPPFPATKDEKLKIFLASRNVLSEYLNIQKDELKLSRHTLRATYDGALTMVYQEVGAYTNTGGRIARAIRTDLLELSVPLPRFDADWVKIGDPATVYTDLQQNTWTGKVVRKGQFIEENTQSINIYIQLRNNPENSLLVGEFLNASFEGHPIDNVMQIPRNAVFNTNEVFIIVDGRLQKRIINVIKRSEQTLLFRGLNEGEIIVLQPLINVLEGTLVSWSGDPDSNEGRNPGSPDGQRKGEGQEAAKEKKK